MRELILEFFFDLKESKRGTDVFPAENFLNNNNSPLVFNLMSGGNFPSAGALLVVGYPFNFLLRPI